jgi:DNA repair exonuclease SbcCD nuclease subunit
MLKVLTIGDPHFGRQPSFLKPGYWRKCVSDMLQAALDAALKAKVDVIVILGDVFDNNTPKPKDHAEFVDFVFKAHESGLKVIVLRGNHDYEDSESNALEPYEKMRGMIKVINKPTMLKLNGVMCKFYPWQPPDVHEDLGAIKSKTPMLVFHHTEAHGSKMDNGWLADGFHPDARHFYVGGHLHTWQLVGKRAIYPGVALVHHWNHDPKGFMLLKANVEGNKLRVSHTQLPYVPPFWMRELSLADYRKAAKTDKRRVYYRTILEPGDDVPDDKRVVSHKRIGTDAVANDNKKSKKKFRTLEDTLPNPLVWLVEQLPEPRRDRAHKILVAVPRNSEEDY